MAFLASAFRIHVLTYTAMSNHLARGAAEPG